MSSYVPRMKRAFELARAGDDIGAVKAPQEALRDALAEGDRRRASLVALPISVIAGHAGDVPAAFEAVRTALEAAPGDARLLYALAGLEQRHGDRNLAADLFRQCYEAARASGDGGWDAASSLRTEPEYAIEAECRSHRPPNRLRRCTRGPGEGPQSRH